VKLRPYPKYKPSGIEWLGDVPERWSTLALKFVVSMQSGEQITAERIELTGDYPVFGGNGLRGYTSTFTHDGSYALIGRQGALCGNVNYANGKFWASEHAVVVSPLIQCSTIWLGELLRTMNLGQYSITAAQPGLSVDAISRLRIPVPTPSEQSAIAAFLDRETAKIDTLIARQEKLVELLQEKRQAVISHAVTKGLDPTVPMKPSGVEWLGDVPDHWKITGLRHVCELLRDGTHLPPPRVDEGVPLLSVRNIQNERFSTRDDDSLISEADYEELSRSFTVEQGDVLLAIVGATLGKVAVVKAAMPRFHIQRSLAVLRAATGVVDGCYLAYYLRSSGFQATLWSRVGFSAQPGIYLGAIAGFQCPVPTLAEQSAIVAYLDDEIAKIDTLTAKAQQAIELQKEHRTALVSAAVTGKIDVRGLAEQGIWEVKAA
jgi:type I restriction enzyme S subunit